MATRVLIIGGSDAGIAAALRAREVDPRAEVTVVVADAYPNYSICGLPFYLSGEVPDWHALAHRTAADIEAHGVVLLLNHTAQAINLARRDIAVTDQSGQTRALPYDRLVIATGTVPLTPRIRGIDLPGVYVLHSMDDAFAVHAHLAHHAPRTALIIGGGYIGVEMADALTHRGLAVTVVEQAPAVLTTVHHSLGQRVGSELERHGVTVATGVRVEEIVRADRHLGVRGSNGFAAVADLILVVVGVRPHSDLARDAGIALGEREAIRVTRAMETNVEGVYAAGDCVETWDRLLWRPTYRPLGTTAHKQGRIAGENVVGRGGAQFAGSLGTQVVKVFDLAAAGTGLDDEAARTAGFDPKTVEVTVSDHKAYYPGAHDVRIRVTGDRNTDLLLGAQMLGHWQAGVATRIDVFAAALFNGFAVDELNELDLSYTPPLGSPWDPVQIAAQAWSGTS